MLTGLDTVILGAALVLFGFAPFWPIRLRDELTRASPDLFHSLFEESRQFCRDSDENAKALRHHVLFMASAPNMSTGAREQIKQMLTHEQGG